MNLNMEMAEDLGIDEQDVSNIELNPLYPSVEINPPTPATDDDTYMAIKAGELKERYQTDFTCSPPNLREKDISEKTDVRRYSDRYDPRKCDFYLSFAVPCSTNHTTLLTSLFSCRQTCEPLAWVTLPARDSELFIPDELLTKNQAQDGRNGAKGANARRLAGKFHALPLKLSSDLRFILVTALDNRLGKLAALEKRGVKLRAAEAAEDEAGDDDKGPETTEELLEEDGDYAMDYYDEEMDMLDDAGDHEDVY
jgi:hypothetical protein